MSMIQKYSNCVAQLVFNIPLANEEHLKVLNSLGKSNQTVILRWNQIRLNVLITKVTMNHQVNLVVWVISFKIIPLFLFLLIGE